MTTTTLSHHPRLRRAQRWGSEGLHRLATTAYAVARRTPMPRDLRTQLRNRVAWQPRLEVVPVDKVMLGGQNKVSASDWAAGIGDLTWPSTPVAAGPHVALLELAAGRELSDAEILASSYAEMARRCIAMSGQFFSATDETGIVAVARDFLADSRSGPHELTDPRTPQRARKPHQSRLGAPVEVAPIRDSECYQVIDGHHRVAALAAAGVPRVAVRVNRISVRTPLQEMLGSMSWIGGERELYQPITAPEVSTWPVVRGCQDRLDAMLRLLGPRGFLDPEMAGSSYLDVASCYGWFVAQMGQAGFEARGIERDPVAPRLGELVYGLDPDHVATGDAIDFLAQAGRQWDVVSCFSLLHHFVLGRASISADEMLKLLDRATGSVLFIDTGQEHESWFTESLAGWDTERIRAFLQQGTTFDKVIDLGPDRDDRPPYSGNYGRHLFACVRER